MCVSVWKAVLKMTYTVSAGR